MKRTLKIIIPIVLAVIVTLAVPHLRSHGGCSCHAPLMIFGGILGCADSKEISSQASSSSPDAGKPASDVRSGTNMALAGHKVTFIEIGSVNCIPSKMMQPIMKEIEDQYKGQVKILFYDVWTPQGKDDARRYAIRLIPTQIFLDSQGNEYYRHEGFFPKDEIVDVLKMKGVK